MKIHIFVLLQLFKYLHILLFSFIAVSTRAQTTLRGDIQMRGVKGFVTLTQTSQGQPISVTTALTGLTQSNTMVLREVRVHYDGSSDMCSAARLGAQ